MKAERCERVQRLSSRPRSTWQRKVGAGAKDNAKRPLSEKRWLFPPERGALEPRGQQRVTRGSKHGSVVLLLEGAGATPRVYVPSAGDFFRPSESAQAMSAPKCKRQSGDQPAEVGSAPSGPSTILTPGLRP